MSSPFLYAGIVGKLEELDDSDCEEWTHIQEEEDLMIQEDVLGKLTHIKEEEELIITDNGKSSHIKEGKELIIMDNRSLLSEETGRSSSEPPPFSSHNSLRIKRRKKINVGVIRSLSQVSSALITASSILKAFGLREQGEDSEDIYAKTIAD